MKKIFTLILIICISTASALAKTQVEKHIFKQTTPSTEICVYYPEFTTGQWADSLNLEMIKFYHRTNSGAKYPQPKSLKELEAMWVFTGDTLAKIGMTKSIDPIKYTNLGGWMLFENRYITSLVVSCFNIFGNGFPEVGILNLNYNNESGKRFNPHALILDTTDILEDVGDIFCKERKLPRNAMRLETGLKYELADLPMPRNIAFGHEGVLLIYNKGEIAPRSMPMILIMIPYSKIDRGLPADFYDTRNMIESGYVETLKRVKKIEEENTKYYKPQKIRRY